MTALASVSIGASLRPTAAPGGRRFKIGRASDNDIVLVDDTVSRYHAELRFLDDGRLLLRDIQSRHGTQLVHYGEQREIEADFVGRSDTIYFGDMEVSVGDLLDEIALKHPELAAAVTDREARIHRCRCGALRRARESCPECG
jgi:hypothetical protein